MLKVRIHCHKVIHNCMWSKALKLNVKVVERSYLLDRSHAASYSRCCFEVKRSRSQCKRSYCCDLKFAITDKHMVGQWPHEDQ